ncbi:MAG TPA: hypothetical protein VGC32_17055 [Solirubrobacterales bacterium]
MGARGPTVVRPARLWHRREINFPIAALAALVLLVLAPSAGAQTLVGEGGSPANGLLTTETDLVSTSAAYDSTAGSIAVTATVAGPLEPTLEDSLVASLGRPVGGSCKAAPKGVAVPAAEVVVSYADSLPPAFWLYQEEDEEGSKVPFGEAARSLTGDQIGATASSPYFVDQPFSCAVIATEGVKGSASAILDEISFPLGLPAPAAPVVPTAPTSASGTGAPMTAPAPGVLAIARPKTLTAKVDRRKKEKITLTNSGGTTIAPVTVKAKAPAGVVLGPASGKLALPALAPGESWTVSLWVTVTAKARPRSTVALTGTASGLTASTSFVVGPVSG